MTPRKLDAPDGIGLARIAATVFAPFACGYFLSYFFRTVNAVIAPNLASDIGLGAADLGFLTAAYFLAFAAAQLPIGVALDRFGPRRTQAALLLSMALGAGIFSAGENGAVLTAGRALIGLGAAGGLMSGLKAIALWFPSERLPRINAFYLAIGGLGALASTAPVEAALHVVHWRELFALLAALTAAVAALIFLTVPERASAAPQTNLGQQLRDLGQIYRDRLFWRVTPLMATAAGTSMAIQSLWAGPWLRDVGGFDRAGVAGRLLLMTMALTAGLLLSGFFADLGRRHGLSLTAVIGLSVVAFLAFQVGIMLELTAVTAFLWMGFGFFGNMTSLAFALFAQHFPLALTGRANTSANTVAILTAFSVQYLIGAAIDLWPRGPDGTYASEGYLVGFGVMFALQVAALIWFLWPRPR
jgi:MFS family permease